MRETIDALVEDLVQKRHVDFHTAELKAYADAAVPHLLRHLKSGDPQRRAVALFGLQHCWSPEAHAPVAALLQETGADLDARRMAAIVIGKREGLAELARLCRPLLEDPRPELAGLALDYLEAHAPDFERTRRVLAQPERRAYLWKHLPRYYAPVLSPDTRALLESAYPEAAEAALVALIHQNDRSEHARSQARAWLGRANPFRRELAAEYFTWHGSAQDREALRQALEGERDLYASASIQGALEAIGRREERQTPGVESPAAGSGSCVGEAGSSPWDAYRQALELLEKGPSAERFQKAFSLYAGAERWEPTWSFLGAPPAEEFIAARNARLDLQARLFAIPGRVPKAASESRGPFDAPRAGAVVAPLRDYLDPERLSYGQKSESFTKGFRGLLHVGDDVAWYHDHLTVLAVADGMVRQVSCASSWGNLVVVEHRGENGAWFCSLYAHLSPFVHVAPGARVRKGQKLGAIGRTLTWENGGYPAHLHFGVHWGPYVQIYRPGEPVYMKYEGRVYLGRVLRSDPEETEAEMLTHGGRLILGQATTWLRGYISPRQWEQGPHYWVSPQAFMAENLEPQKE